MRIRVAAVLFCALAGPGASIVCADPPPRVGPFVVDLHGTFPNFPSDSGPLADSRGLPTTTPLPGLGIGVAVGAHVYPLRWRAVTFGIGGQWTTGRSSATPLALPGQLPPPTLTEHFTSIEPEVSFNFGGPNGWSYISGGLGRSTWSLIPAGAAAQPADTEALKTINYGGGARWFPKRHLGVSFDVRFYAINPGGPNGLLPGSPREALLVVGAGVSVR